MSKRSDQRRAREKRKRREKRKERLTLSDAELEQVLVWKNRIDDSIQDALSCYRWIEHEGRHNDKFARLALAKSVENLADAITELDKASHGTLLGALVEIPEESDDPRAMTWRNIKGIRVRLAHKYWEIDYNIVIPVVRDDFPKLEALFERLHIEPSSQSEEGRVSLTIETLGKNLEPQTTAAEEDPPLPGNSVIMATYHPQFGWLLFRFFRREDGSMSCLPLFYGEVPEEVKLRFSMYGVRHQRSGA